MITRREGEGWRLITQPAHAWLSGELAAAWGSAACRGPEPFAAVTLAARLHDLGWLALDEAPVLDAQGAPRNFMDTPLEDTASTWRRAVAHLRLWDPYAAILVSQHATTIYEGRLARGADPVAEAATVQGLLAEQATWRAELRAVLVDHPRYRACLADGALRDAYRWLRLCDLLSLIICSDALPARGELADVPGPTPGEYLVMRYERPDRGSLRLAPWPFAASELRLSVETRRLANGRFDGVDALRAAVAAAAWSTQDVLIAPLI